MYKKTTAFTLVELIISITILSVFMMLWTSAFWNILTNIQYIKSFWEEQEALLYDDFAFNEILANPEEITKINSTSTWFIFKLDTRNNDYPYASLNFIEKTNNYNWTYYNLGIKKLIPVNDIINIWAQTIFSAPWENDIKDINTGNSIISNFGLLKNPTWLFFDGTKTYISDTWNSCIRELNGWMVSNCLYGQEKNPWDWIDKLISPTYMVKSGIYIYVSDTYNNKIKKIDTTNWNITDFYGNGNFWNDITQSPTQNNLSLPTGLAIDWNDLYISDSWNNRILKVNLTSNNTEVLIWNMEKKSIFLWNNSLASSTIPISLPTKLQINWWNLYFLEADSGLIKSINLTTGVLQNEIWSNKNLTYFWTFEVSWYNNSMNLNWFTHEIVNKTIQIPYNGDKSLKLLWTAVNTWSIDYSFSQTSFWEAQWLRLKFYIKNIDYESDKKYKIKYWFVNSWNFLINNYKEIEMENHKWQQMYIDSTIPTNTDFSWFKIEIFSSDWSDVWDAEFLIDNLSLFLNNSKFTWNTNNKFENIFDYIGSFYINWSNSYISSIFDWINYNFDISNLNFSKNNYNFLWINTQDVNYLFDDYLWTVKILNYSFDDLIKINESNSNKFIWFNLLLNTFNWFSVNKYISITSE